MFIFALATSARVTWLNWIHHPTFYFGLQFDLLFPRWSWWKLFFYFFTVWIFSFFCWLHNTTTQQKAIKKKTTLTKNTWINLNNWRFSSTDLLNLFFLTLQFNFFALFFKYSFTFEVLFVTLLFCIYFGLCLSFIFRISFANIFHYIFFEEYIHPSIHPLPSYVYNLTTKFISLVLLRGLKNHLDEQQKRTGIHCAAI